MHTEWIIPPSASRRIIPDGYGWAVAGSHDVGPCHFWPDQDSSFPSEPAIPNAVRSSVASGPTAVWSVRAFPLRRCFEDGRWAAFACKMQPERQEMTGKGKKEEPSADDFISKSFHSIAKLCRPEDGTEGLTHAENIYLARMSLDCPRGKLKSLGHNYCIYAPYGIVSPGIDGLMWHFRRAIIFVKCSCCYRV